MEATSLPCYIICDQWPVLLWQLFKAALLGTKKTPPPGTDYFYRTWRSWSVQWRVNGQNSTLALCRNSSPSSNFKNFLKSSFIYCHEYIYDNYTGSQKVILSDSYNQNAIFSVPVQASHLIGIYCPPDTQAPERGLWCREPSEKGDKKAPITQWLHGQGRASKITQVMKDCSPSSNSTKKKTN